MGLLEELLHPLEKRSAQRSTLLLRRRVERLERLALSRIELVGDLEDQPIARVAVTARAQLGHALAAEPDDLVGLTAGNDLELRRAADDGHVHLGAERQLDERHGQLAMEVGAVAGEELVLAQ